MDCDHASIIGRKQEIRSASLRRAHQAIAGLVGLAMHRVAGKVRRIIFATAEADPANLAVLCDAFLRYGAAQAAGLRSTG